MQPNTVRIKTQYIVQVSEVYLLCEQQQMYDNNMSSGCALLQTICCNYFNCSILVVIQGMINERMKEQNALTLPGRYAKRGGRHVGRCR